MKCPLSKVKPIRRLYHQFGTFLKSPRLDAYQICEALERARLIEVVAHVAPAGDPLPTHYRETARMREIAPDAFRVTVQTALRRGHRDAQPAFLQLNDIRCISDTEYSATLRAGDLELKERRALGLRGCHSEEELAVVGDVCADGRMPDLTAGQNLTVFFRKENISITAARFDKNALNSALKETFDYVNYERERNL